MATYFADTSFWMALSHKRDRYHRYAVAWNEFVIRTESVIVTTEAVLWEWLNALCDGNTRGVAAEGYRRAYADARIEVVPLTDCMSFVVTERRHLTEALSTDRHFEQAGLRAMMLEEPPI